MYYKLSDPYYLNPYMRHSSSRKRSINARSLKVVGNDSVKASPDMANVILGVQTENTDLKIAQNENAIITTKVINALTSIGISEKNINTDSYSIEPQYDYVDGKQIFRSYKVINSIRIITKAINNVGQIVDTATANGANIVNSITFSLSDTTPYYRKALNLALEDALMKARTISNNLGVILDEIPINVIEENYNITPSVERKTLTAAASTPIMPGQIDITARINATFNYE
jgi:uncharacterized protein YggE